MDLGYRYGSYPLEMCMNHIEPWLWIRALLLFGLSHMTGVTEQGKVVTFQEALQVCHRSSSVTLGQG